jgi:hypothetical protein
VVNAIGDIAWTINADGRRVLAAEGLYGRRNIGVLEVLRTDRRWPGPQRRNW